MTIKENQQLVKLGREASKGSGLHVRDTKFPLKENKRLIELGKDLGKHSNLIVRIPNLSTKIKMSDNKKIILFLLTGDIAHLPEEYPQVDIKKWSKKSELQKMREIKRLVSADINSLKTN